MTNRILRCRFRLKKLFFNFLILFSFISVVLSAQPFVIDSGSNVTHSPGNDLFPKWSPDGKKLLYQSDRNGNRDIFIYDIQTGSSYQLTSSLSDEQHPVWFDKGRKVVFDSDRNGLAKLYVLDTATKKIKLLFNRDIQGREASFGNNDNLVFFSGFDEHEKKWEIYSYEFYYRNLNKLYGNAEACFSPAVSPKGDRILFLITEKGEIKSRLVMINWYGNVLNLFDDFDFLDPAFGPDGNMIYFVSKKDNPQGEVYSMHKNGSHLERLTDDEYVVCCPQISPDGSKIALSVKIGEIYDIYIAPLEEY